MKASIGKNLIFDVSYRIFNVIAPLITAPYISRVIGVDGIGYHSYTQNVAGYFTIAATLGTISYGQREIAYCGNDIEKRSKVFCEINILRGFISLIVLLAYLVFVNTTSGIIKSLLLVQTIDLLGGVTDITWLYQGIENFFILAIRNIAMKLTCVTAILVFVKSESDLLLYVLIISGSTLISNVIMLLDIKKYIQKVRLRELHIFRHFLPMVRLFIPTIALSIYNQIDKTMLWTITQSSSECGYYEQTTKILTILITLVSSIGNVTMPRTAKLYAEGNKEGIIDITYKAINFTLFLSIPIIFGVSVVAKGFVAWFFGRGYGKVSELLIISSSICVPMAIKYVIGNQYLISIKKEKIYIGSLLVGLVVNIVLNAVLIPTYMSVGAVVASVISEASIMVFQLFAIKRTIHISNILKKAYKYILSAIIMYLILLFVTTKLMLDGFKVLLVVPFGVIIYMCVLLILRDETVLQLGNKFKIYYQNKRNNA